MSKEYTLIYFRRTDCLACKQFDERNIFSQLQIQLPTKNIKTVIIDSNLPNSVENQNNIARYSEELDLFQNYYPNAPSLCLFYGPAKPLNTLFGFFGGSSSFLDISPKIKFLKIDITKDFQGILKEIIAQKKVISDPAYKNPESLIHKNKYIKYKYKYLELKNIYLQQK